MSCSMDATMTRDNLDAIAQRHRLDLDDDEWTEKLIRASPKGVGAGPGGCNSVQQRSVKSCQKESESARSLPGALRDPYVTKGVLSAQTVTGTNCRQPDLVKNTEREQSRPVTNQVSVKEDCNCSV
jgi:hypothetical protein